MHPLLFQFGPLSLRIYGLMVAIAFVAALYLASRLGESRGLSRTFVMDAVTLAVASGILGARILFVALNWSEYRAQPWAIFKIWEGGLVFYGGFILAAATLVYYTKSKKQSLGLVADVFAPALALGQAIGRWGCFFAGCCYGRPTAHFWGVTFQDPLALAPLGIKLHPTQLYESLGLLGISVTLFFQLTRQRWPQGVIFWAYVFLYGLLRYLVEIYRGDDRGGFYLGWSPSQWVALAAMLTAGTVLALRVGHRHENT